MGNGIPLSPYSEVAQWLACLAHNQKVGGSIPLLASLDVGNKLKNTVILNNVG